MSSSHFTSPMAKSPCNRTSNSNRQVDELGSLPLHFSIDNPESFTSPILINPLDVEGDHHGTDSTFIGNDHTYEEDGSITL
jgi:hypothetical protein